MKERTLSSTRASASKARPALGHWPVLVVTLLVSCGSHPTGLGPDTSSSSGGDNTAGDNSSGGGFGMTGTSSGFGGGDDGGGTPTSSQAIPTNLPPFVLDDTGKSGLPASTIAQLKMGGSSCTATVVYPYKDTMFAAEGLPPVIQWSGSSDSAYIKMTYGNTAQVLYQAAIGASNPGTFPVPQAAWNPVSIRTAAPPAPRTPLQVTLTTISGTSVSTCNLEWYVAPGALTGAVYYASYDDPSAAQMLGYSAGDQGAVLRLPFGAPQPEVFLLYKGPPAPMSGTGPCISCHSVSARGSSLVASQHDYAGSYDSYGGGSYTGGGGGSGSMSSGKSFEVFGYNIQTNPNPEPPKISSTGIQSGSFGALTADGQFLLTMGNPECTAGADTYPRAPNNFPTVEGSVVAKMWDMKTGQPVTASGLNPDYYMWMPQFSPNGDKVVFNHAKPGPNGRTDRRELATMDYDATTRTFSNLQVLYHDPGPAPSQPYTGYTDMAGTGPIPTGANGCTTKVPTSGTWDDTCTDLCYPGWPFFTPDGKKVIFVRGTEPDFISLAPGIGRYSPSPSKLFIVDVATKNAHELANANAGPTSMDLGYDYFTTMMPVAAGGQFWAFFTSRRTYGNTKYAGITSPDSKKIWVSAIDINAPDNVDPSHPPFYLPGQGKGGNIRAFPVLNPCKANGASCASGLDCCGGSCIIQNGAGTCGARPPQMCAQLNDNCTTSSDCCDNSQQCLGGFCSLPPPK